MPQEKKPKKVDLKNIPDPKKEMPKKKRSKFWTCCLIVLIVFLVLIFLVFPSLVAALGIVKVPLLSKIFYHSKRPDIIFNVPKKDLAEMKFTTLRNDKNEVYAVKTTEKDLNAYLIPKVTKETDVIQDPIFLLHKGEIEIWTNVKKSLVDADLNVVLTVKLKKGKISVVLTKVKLGRLGIPKSYLTSFSDEINKQLQQEMGKNQDVTLDKLTIREDAMIIEGKAKE